MTYIILSPANWIILLLLLSCFLRKTKWKKQCIMAALIVFIVFSNSALFLWIMKLWQTQPVELAKGKYETGILLGGINWMQHGSNGYMKNGSDRFIQANKLYHQGMIQKLIVSAGGEDSTRKEAQFLKQQLIAAGVSPTNIIVEERSTTTYENGRYCKYLIDSLKLQSPFVLITSAFHMPRAEKVFAKAGIAVVSFPCDYEDTGRKQSLLSHILPDIEVLDKWTALLKEWAGIIVYRMQGKI